ncbi:MAG: hypothetical protein ABEJ42_10450 [Halobacteriaceae archaeon]
MDEPLLVGGAIHHLDILASLADAPPARVFARTWNPPWSEFAGNAQALVDVTFANGVEATYEGAVANASSRNGWGNDYVRAECRDATLTLDARTLERVSRDPDGDPVLAGPRAEDGEELPLATGEQWMGTRVVGQFLDWLEGGNPMPTHIEANLDSTALVFAAAESGRTGEPVDVAAFRDRALDAARADIDGG